MQVRQQKRNNLVRYAGGFLIPHTIQPNLFIETGSGADGMAYRTDRDGNPNVFNLERNEDGLWLNDNWTNPTNKWNPDNEFVFRLRKYVLSALTECGFSSQGFPSFSSSRRAFCRFPPVLARSEERRVGKEC